MGGRNTAPKCKDEWVAGCKKEQMYTKTTGRNEEMRVHSMRRGYREGGNKGNTSIFKGTPRTGKPRWRWGRDREEGGDVGEGEKVRKE